MQWCHFKKLKDEGTCRSENRRFLSLSNIRKSVEDQLYVEHVVLSLQNC